MQKRIYSQEKRIDIPDLAFTHELLAQLLLQYALDVPKGVQYLDQSISLYRRAEKGDTAGTDLIMDFGTKVKELEQIRSEVRARFKR